MTNQQSIVAPRPRGGFYEEPIAPEEPIAVVKIYAQDLNYTLRQEAGVRVETEVIGGTGAKLLERVQLIADAAERVAGGAGREQIGEALAKIADSLGERPAIRDHNTVHAKLEAMGNSLVSIRSNMEVLAQRRVDRALARDRSEARARRKRR